MYQLSDFPKMKCHTIPIHLRNEIFDAIIKHCDLGLYWAYIHSRAATGFRNRLKISLRPNKSSLDNSDEGENDK